MPSDAKRQSPRPGKCHPLKAFVGVIGIAFYYQTGILKFATEPLLASFLFGSQIPFKNSAKYRRQLNHVWPPVVTLN